jgi:hypothetical protein
MGNPAKTTLTWMTARLVRFAAPGPVAMLTAATLAVAPPLPRTSASQPSCSAPLGSDFHAPISQRTEQLDPPVSPFANPQQPTNAQRGTIVLSDGTSIPGWIYTTQDQPLRLYVPASRRYVQIALRQVLRIQAIVQWQHQQPQWYWKEPANDEKILTGQVYPVRKSSYRIRLRDDSELVGDVAQTLWLRQEDGQVRRFLLHKRQKADPGTALQNLLSVQEVLFDPDRTDRDAAAAPTSRPATQSATAR